MRKVTQSSDRANIDRAKIVRAAGHGLAVRGTVMAMALAGTLLGGLPARAATVGPVTDDLGVIRIAKGAPVQIGAYWVISGADTALGIDERRGVELAFKDLGGTIMGHPIKLNVEDDGCNAEGGQTAATKLAANPQNVIVIGPACSSSATAAAPILWQAGLTDIGTATTAPTLTAANRKPEYDGYVRTVYSDVDQGKSDANYLYNVLKARKMVAIHDGSPYAQQVAAETGKNFIALGGQVLSTEAVAPNDVDMHPVLTRVASEKPDVVYLPIFVAAAAQILRQAKETPGLQQTPLMGGSGLMAADLIEAAGPAVVGFRIGYPDVSPSSLGKDYPRLVDEYKKAYGEAPISGYHANAYDGAVLAFKAIMAVAKADSAGNLYIGKKALNEAVYRTKFEGMAGPVACDPHGQCAQFKPAVYEFTNATASTFSIGTNPKKIWP